MLENGKPASRGRRDGLSADLLGGTDHRENNPKDLAPQQCRTSPADLICAADRLERMAGRGDAENLLRIASRFRSWAVEAGRIAA